MNKKFSTLMAGTLLALSTSAFAAVTTGDLVKVDAAAGAVPFVSGNSYYVVVDADGTLDANDVLVGQKLNTTNLEAYNAKLNEATALETNYLWKVTEVAAPEGVYYTFYNESTEHYLAIEADGVSGNGKMVTKAADAVQKDGVSIYFKFAAGAKYNGTSSMLTSALAGLTNKDLAITNGTPDAIATKGSGSSILLYQKAASGLSSKNLNELLGDGFMFNFPKADPAPSTNPFSNKMVAVKVASTRDVITLAGASSTATNKDIFIDDTYAGLYFVSSAAASGTVKDVNGETYFTSKAKFEASKFLAVDPIANYNINGFTVTNGDGFKFRTVSGEDFVSVATKGKVMLDNAKFTVTEVNPLNAKGSYEISVKPAVTAAKKADGTAASEEDAKVLRTAVNVVAFTTMGSTYVTTMSNGTYGVGSTKDNTVTIAKVSSSNLLTAKDLLKSNAPAVFNIQFTSGKADLTNDNGTSSEYGKYLGIGVNVRGAYNLLAQGPAFLDLDAPQNQWYVSDVKDGAFTFKNRENAGEINLQLRKTSTANVYDVLSTDATTLDYSYIDANGLYKTTTATNGFNSGKLQIKLVPATIDKSAGYLNLTDEQLAQPIHVKFTVANKLLTRNMYLSASTKTATQGVTLTEDTEIATLWDIVKFDTKADSISGKIKYAYMKDEKTMDYKEVVDKAITTYALKINGLSKAWYLDFPNAGTPLNSYAIKQTDKVEQAQRYILKAREDGSIYLIAANLVTSNAYSDQIDNTKTALTVNTSAQLDDINIYDDAQDQVKMEFESVTLLSESLEAQPRHASFQSINGGFLGMDENNDAIIAATKDEAQALTFWLDTTDVKELSTSFYISQAVASEPEAETKAAAVEPRMFLFNAVDSVSYYDEGTASTTKDYNYLLNDGATVKAIFKAATLVNKDSINTIVKGKEVGLNKDNGLNKFKFQIVEDAEIENAYNIKTGNDYLMNINGKLGFGPAANALVVKLGTGDATANEAIEAAGVQVIGGQGVVTVQGAAGKVVTVANILGQTIANQVATSDNVTIAVPAGIVVVAVDGEATKVVVK